MLGDTVTERLCRRPPQKQFFFPFLITGYGLKCYQCLSTLSWDDCASNKKEQTCPSGTDTCAKIFFEGLNAGNFSATTHKMYASSCGVKSLCNQNLCKTIAQQRFTVNTCEVHCCDDDLCNEPKVSPINAFILLVYALLTLFRCKRHYVSTQK